MLRVAGVVVAALSWAAVWAPTHALRPQSLAPGSQHPGVSGAVDAGCSPPPWDAFVAHVVYHPNNPSSVAAKKALRLAMCARFGIDPCTPLDQQPTPPSPPPLFHLPSDLSLRFPASELARVLPWLAQSTSAVVSSAQYPTDLKVEPVVEGCAGADVEGLSVSVGVRYGFNVYELHASTTTTASTVPHDVGLHPAAQGTAFDASEQFLFNPANPTAPFANHTHCTDASQVAGLYLHVLAVPNHPNAVAAAERFQSLLSAQLHIHPSIFCPTLDLALQYETVHRDACWVRRRVPTADERHATPFVVPPLSLYVPAPKWGDVFMWALHYRRHLQQDGQELSIVTHPVTGCNYADIAMWSMHAGPEWPVNTFALTRASPTTPRAANTLPVPPSCDDRSQAHPFPREVCDSFPFDEFVLNLLFNPIDKSSTLAKDKLLQDLGRTFKALVQKGDIAAIEDDPYSYTKATSPFLAGQVQVRVAGTAIATAVPWLMEHRPKEVDIVLTPDGGCMYHDYFSRSFRIGNVWVYNDYGLRNDNLEAIFEFDSGAVLEDEAEEELEGKLPPVPFSEQGEDDSACKQSPWDAFVMYVLYPPGNAWASQAFDTFFQNLADYFELTRQECAQPYPAPYKQPVLSRLCLMNEVPDPTSNPNDPMVAPYGSVFVPVGNFTEVLSWAMDNKAAMTSGYELDVMVVPMTGCKEGFTQWVLRAGETWPVNVFAVDRAARRRDARSQERSWSAPARGVLSSASV